VRTGAGVTIDFEVFFHTTYAGMRARAIVLCGHWYDAEDAVAEAYTQAFVRWDKLSQYESPEGWVFRVMQQRLWKSARRQARESPTLDVPVPPHASPEQVAEVHEVLRALAALPRRQRIVMGLHSQGTPNEEIATALSVSEATVRTYLFRAREKLRGLLERTPASDAGEALVPSSSGSALLRLPADPVATGVRDATQWLKEAAELDQDARDAMYAWVKATGAARAKRRRRVPRW